jgi:hypothetical protein
VDSAAHFSQVGGALSTRAATISQRLLVVLPEVKPFEGYGSELTNAHNSYISLVIIAWPTTRYQVSGGREELGITEQY